MRERKKERFWGAELQSQSKCVIQVFVNIS